MQVLGHRTPVGRALAGTACACGESKHPVQSTHTLPRAPRRPARRPPPASVPASHAVVLDRYRLLERLGAGGFGEVWRAHDELLDREVALKRVPLAGEGESARAAREALAAARLAHPAIVVLLEAHAAPDAFYLVSELVHGHTLAQLIAACSLADGEVLEIGIALADALEHAHARGVIHRDVKPQNVLVPDVSHDARLHPGMVAAAAKLTDFGGARMAGEDVLTRTGDVLGTLAYMAPEQSEGGEAGEAADLYSLALVLYEALCGVNPVRGASPAATARRLGRPIQSLRRRRPDLSPALIRALDRALDPCPERRGSVAELRAALAGRTSSALTALQPGERSQATPSRSSFFSRIGAPPHWSEPEPSEAPLARTRARREAAGEHELRRQPARAHRLAGHRASERAAQAPVQQAAPSARAHLPRALWVGGVAALLIWEASAGRPGVSLLALAALLPLALVRRRAGPWPLTGALAPLLGLVRLAGGFPAVAGQAAGWRTRAALGALGYWWLTLSEPLLSRRLWLGPAPGTPPRAQWEGSLHSTAVHVIGPTLTLGVLLGAALWGAGAMCLPWLVRGRSAALDVVAATMWSAALAAFAAMLDSGVPAASAAHASPRGAVLGAVFGGALAVAACALRAPV